MTRTVLMGFTCCLVLASACAGNGDQTQQKTQLAPSAAITTASAQPGDHGWITLITGDRVYVSSGADGRLVAQLKPAAGRERVGFATVRRMHGGKPELLVVPHDAAPLLAAGELDERLFNLTLLLEQGFADSKRHTLPLIVPRKHASARRALRTPHARALRSLDADAFALAKVDASSFWSAFLRERARPTSTLLAHSRSKLWLDGVARPLLDQSVPQIGGPEAWRLGFTGAGVRVALLDTGVLLTHPDFAGRVAETKDFTDTRPDASDDVGHGTHCAGIIAGSGAASSGKYRGVAPDATLLVGRVCTLDGCPESAIIAGMEWAAERARIVSMSLGGGGSDGTDPLSTSLNALSDAHGTLFVVAAGNSGDFDRVSTPASADRALAVASVTHDDTTSDFSSRGPRVGDYAVKPDLAAPGDGIVSARAPGTVVGDEAPIDASYCRLSGTSMATPHVAGAAALLAQAHPDWDGAELRAGLLSAVKALDGVPVREVGTGRLDVGRAVAQPVHVDSGSVSFAISRYPHAEAPVARAIVYHNTGAAPVTLDLTYRAASQNVPAPDGMFALATSHITIPAHGKTEVGLQLDVSTFANGETSGFYSGRIEASGADGMHLVTAFGAFIEPESHDLTIETTPRTSADILTLSVVNPDSGDTTYVELDEQGRGQVRLAKRSYDVFLDDLTSTDSEYAEAFVVEPDVLLDRDRTLRLDGRDAKPVRLRVDRKDAELRTADFDVIMGSVNTGVLMLSPPGAVGAQLFARPTAKVDSHPFGLNVSAQLGARNESASSVPYTYNLRYRTSQGIPEALDFRARDRDLALFKTFYRSQGIASEGTRVDIGFFADDLFLIGLGEPQALPGQRDEYFLASNDLQWQHARYLSTDWNERLSETDTTSYQPGISLRSYNKAPLAPAFADELTWGGVKRSPGVIEASLGLFSPSDRGYFSTQLGGETSGSLSLLAPDGSTQQLDTPEHGSFAVSAGAGTYTLHAQATRSATWSALGTSVDARWTFPSQGAADADNPEILPLLAVRANAILDEQNRAPAGVIFPLMLEARHQLGAAAANITELGLDVSYDDGATWQHVPALRFETGAFALLHHPASAGFVSLRVHARDAAGSSLEQTMIRAYQTVSSKPQSRR